MGALTLGLLGARERDQIEVGEDSIQRKRAAVSPPPPRVPSRDVIDLVWCDRYQQALDGLAQVIKKDLDALYSALKTVPSGHLCPPQLTPLFAV